MNQTLGFCVTGKVYHVKQVLPSALSSKLLEMGFYAGKEVEILYKAPFGDPIAVRVGDYVLSMRKSEANLVEVENN